MKRLINKWNALPLDTRFPVMMISLVLGALLLMGGLIKLVSPDFQGQRDDACAEYGEMVKLNTKSIGYTCYVEMAPGRWVSDTYYDIAMMQAAQQGQ